MSDRSQRARASRSYEIPSAALLHRPIGSTVARVAGRGLWVPWTPAWSDLFGDLVAECAIMLHLPHHSYSIVTTVERSGAGTYRVTLTEYETEDF